MANKKEPGYRVEGKDGRLGRTKHSDKPIVVKKLPVYWDDGTQTLVTESELKMIGFID